MINYVKLTLEQVEYNALLQAAIDDLRDPASEARYMLRQELQRRGLLSEDMLQTTQLSTAKRRQTNASQK